MCKNCGHLIGYHWPEDETCTMPGCKCAGFSPAEEPPPNAYFLKKFETDDDSH